MRTISELRGEPRVLRDIALANPLVNSLNGLAALLLGLPRLGLVIEVGSYAGVTAELFCHFCEQVICVDHWNGCQRAKREFDARFGDNPKVSYLRMPSGHAACLLSDGIADLVYIDADHDEQEVMADLQGWRPKVRPGGWLAGHDYYDGVKRAVERFLGKPDAVFSDSSWLKQL